METIKYLLDYFFVWTDGGFWHFLMLAFLCYLLGSPSRVYISDTYRQEEDSNGRAQ